MKVSGTYLLLPILLGLAFVGANSLAQSASSSIAISRVNPLPSELYAKLSLEDEMIQEGQAIGPQNILWGNKDLNNDGDPEVIVALVDPAFMAGGSNGFEHRIYTNIEEDAVRILAVNGNEFATDCNKRTEGFCDLIVDGTARMRYESGEYRPVTR